MGIMELLFVLQWSGYIVYTFNCIAKPSSLLGQWLHHLQLHATHSTITRLQWWILSWNTRHQRLQRTGCAETVLCRLDGLLDTRIVHAALCAGHCILDPVCVVYNVWQSGRLRSMESLHSAGSDCHWVHVPSAAHGAGQRWWVALECHDGHHEYCIDLLWHLAGILCRCFS